MSDNAPTILINYEQSLSCSLGRVTLTNFRSLEKYFNKYEYYKTSILEDQSAMPEMDEYAESRMKNDFLQSFIDKERKV